MCTSKRTVDNNAVHVYFPVTHKSSAGTQKKCSDPTRLSFSSFFVFLKQLHISPSQEKRGQLMWRWWVFFVLFCFLAYHFHSPSGITQERIADTLDMTAGPLVKHSDVKQNSRATSCTIKRALTATRRQALKWTVDRKHVLYLNPSQIWKSEEERLQMPAFNFLFNGCKHKLKVHVKEKRLHSTIRNLCRDPKCPKLQKYV